MKFKYSVSALAVLSGAVFALPTQAQTQPAPPAKILKLAETLQRAANGEAIDPQQVQELLQQDFTPEEAIRAAAVVTAVAAAPRAATGANASTVSLSFAAPLSAPVAAAGPGANAAGSAVGLANSAALDALASAPVAPAAEQAIAEVIKRIEAQLPAPEIPEEPPPGFPEPRTGIWAYYFQQEGTTDGYLLLFVNHDTGQVVGGPMLDHLAGTAVTSATGVVVGALNGTSANLTSYLGSNGSPTGTGLAGSHVVDLTATNFSLTFDELRAGQPNGTTVVTDWVANDGSDPISADRPVVSGAMVGFASSVLADRNSTGEVVKLARSHGIGNADPSQIHYDGIYVLAEGGAESKVGFAIQGMTDNAGATHSSGLVTSAEEGAAGAVVGEGMFGMASNTTDASGGFESRYIYAYHSPFYYMSWGTWGLTDGVSTANGVSETDYLSDASYWVAGHPTGSFPASKLQAYYAGGMMGAVAYADSSIESVFGVLDVNVDFTTSAFVGNFDLYSRDSGNAMANGAFDGTVTATGTMQGTVSGQFGNNSLAGGLDGALFGPNAESIGGSWDFLVTDASSNTVASATGVFAAGGIDMPQN